MLIAVFIAIFFLLHVHTGPGMSEQVTQAAPRRGIRWWFLPGMILWPVGTRRRVERITWPAAVAMFVGGAVATYAGLWLITMYYSLASTRSRQTIWDFIPALPSRWQEWAMLAAIVLFYIALTCALPLVISVLMMGWAGRDERVRDTFARCLKTVLAMFGHYAVLILLCSAVFTWVLMLHEKWRMAGRFSGDIPWYMFSLPVAMFLMIVAGALWLFVVTVWTVRVPHWGARSFWPPLCNACGYSLAALPLSGNCPECGLPIAASTSDYDARPGSPLEQRDRNGITGWLQCLILPIVRPATFGRRLKLGCATATAGYMLAGNLILTMIVATILLTIFIIADFLGSTYSADLRWYIEEFLIVTGMINTHILFWTLFIGSLVATVVGVTARRPCGRPMLNVASQAVCYASSFLMIWLIALWLPVFSLLLWAALTGSRPYNLTIFGINAADGAALLTLGLLLLGMVTYIFLCIRITRAARWANW